jgi:hypothetical protein
VTTDLALIAQDIARWLRNKPGVTEVQPPEMAPKLSRPRPRLPIPVALPLPVPSFLSPKHTPGFEIRFTFKGHRRVFRYFVEAVDDPVTIRQEFRVHTNGELLVVVPDEYGHIMPNEIYYGNRSTAAAVLGGIAPGS